MDDMSNWNEFIKYHRMLESRGADWWYVARDTRVTLGEWLIACDPECVWGKVDYQCPPERAPMLFNSKREAERANRKHGGKKVVKWPFKELPKERAVRMVNIKSLPKRR